MEHLYNPDQMSEQEIKATFVARQALLDRLVALVRRQPDGAGVQHVVLVAPRGMGKTTMLLMVQFAVTDWGLDPPWLALRFPEELYGVTDLADFWLETLAELAAGDTSLAEKARLIKARYQDGDTLQEAALSLLREWCRKNGRRLLLLVDNFHQILATLDEQQAAALRNVLMNEGFLMILGAAPSFFKEASNYDEPLYNFFKVEGLERLNFEDMRALLLQRAAADGLTNFEKNLDANTARLRALEYFTGGNVRLVLMLYRVVAQSALLEVRQGLDRLLDQVTPFYKAKTEDLPPQQRKILDHIARTSGQSREGTSPSDIASAVRLTPQLVSAQLKRLADAGYVQSANLRGRSAFYTLSEPLYSLWYQMRFGRDARQRMRWLVDFLKGFYTAEELGEQSLLLGNRFQTLLAAGRDHDARNALEHCRWLVEAMPHRSRYAQLERVIQGYLTLIDTNAIKELGLTDDQLEHLSSKTLDQLVAGGGVTAERAAQAYAARASSQKSQIAAEFEAALLLGFKAYEQGDFEQALNSLDRLLALDEEIAGIWYNRGVVLSKLDRLEEALESYDRVLALYGDDAGTWYNRGVVLGSLERFEEAVASYDRSLALDESDVSAWGNKGVVLGRLNRFEEAVASFDRALALDENDADTWENRGNAQGNLGQHEKALASFDRALALDENDARAWGSKGNALSNLGHLEEAVASFDRALALDEEDTNAWGNMGVVLGRIGQHEEALNSFDRALALDENDAGTWYNRGIVLYNLGRMEEALRNYEQALALNMNDADFWYNRGNALYNLGRLEEVVASYDRALTVVPEHDKNFQVRIRLSKFGAEMALGWIALAAEDWYAAAEVGGQQDNWVTYASRQLLAVAQQGHGPFVRELITSSHTEDQFFPLARALDYLATGEEALIEKLTPEMRPIVEAVVASLHPASERAGETPPPAARRRKRSPAPKRKL